MANLRANRITGTEVFETTGSVQFDGGSSHLRLANTVDFDFATGNFTIEMWFYQTSNASRQDLTGNYVGASNGWGVGTNYDNTNDIIFYHGNTIIINTSTIYSLNTWNHLSVCRDSGTLRLFMNGNLITSVSDTTNISSTRDLRIGGVPTSLDTFQLPFQGHISNLRILKGTALYTKNFTPPTRELTVIPNTVLLCCQSTTRANEEKTGKTITVNGNAVANELTPGLLTDRVKSGGDSAISGSVEFDGDGDYLSLANNNEFDFDTSMTIEAYVYFSDLTSSPVVFSRGGGNTSSSWSTTDGAQFAIYGTSTGRISFEYNSSGTPIQIISATGTLSANSWNHIAVTYNGTTFTLYLNGINVGTASNAPTMPTTRSNIWVGMWPTSALVQDMKGFISNLRIIKGNALYTQNFIPPTRELKRLPGTVLLCCKNSSDPTAEETGKTITVNGNATARNFAPSVGFDGTVTFDGVTKINTPNYFYLPTGNTEDRGRGRGIIAGGYTTGNVNAIEYITISSTGNSIDFGDITLARHGLAACSSSTRGVFGGGSSPSFVNTIDYVTISSTANALDFGDLLATTHTLSSCSSSTRGVWGGGLTPSIINTIQYITIASLGNTVSFGTLTQARHGLAACSSSTRGVFGGGTNPSSSFVNTIDYITIASTGNATDFGDLNQTVVFNANSSCSSSVRGLWGGGETPTNINVIDYITIASTGNATDFGDLTGAKRGVASCSSTSRGIFGGGETPTNLNTIDYVTISTTGNAQDFGDLTAAKTQPSACSDSHGGLG